MKDPFRIICSTECLAAPAQGPLLLAQISRKPLDWEPPWAGWKPSAALKPRLEIRLPTTEHADTIAHVINAEMPYCLIVTGMPGAGKSTVTRLIAERLPRSARIDGYFIGTLVVGGYVWPLGEPAGEAARQVELCNRNLCTLANNLSDAGFTPVIDTVIPNREQLDLFGSLLPARKLLFVVLAPGIEVCQYRNTIRDPRERFDFDGYEALDAGMKRELGGVGWWFDTAALTPEQTVERIVNEAPRRALVN